MSTLNTGDCLGSSARVKNFIEKGGRLPNYIEISDKRYSMEEYLYISSRLIAAICKVGSKAIASDYKKVKVDTPKIIPIKANIDKNTYCDMNKRVADYIIKNDKAPSYVSSKYGNVQYQAHIYSNSKILSYYMYNNILPNYVSLNLDKNSKILTYLPNLSKAPEDAAINAKFYCNVEVDSNKAVNNETKLSLYVLCNEDSHVMIEVSVADRVKLLNNIYKVDVEIEGYKPIIFKKPVEGWKLINDKYNKEFKKSFTVQGKPENIAWKKMCTVKLYDKNGKLLDTDKMKVVREPCLE